jgi:hypothetical protein
MRATVGPASAMRRAATAHGEHGAADVSDTT